MVENTNLNSEVKNSNTNSITDIYKNIFGVFEQNLLEEGSNLKTSLDILKDIYMKNIEEIEKNDSISFLYQINKDILLLRDTIQDKSQIELLYNIWLLLLGFILKTYIKEPIFYMAGVKNIIIRAIGTQDTNVTESKSKKKTKKSKKANNNDI